jgi:hypothetical protein
MTAPTVEVRLTLMESTARKLRDLAQARGVPEETLIEQALTLLLGPDDASPLDEYWLSVAALREDWDAMPDDWTADGANNAVPPR